MINKKLLELEIDLIPTKGGIWPFFFPTEKIDKWEVTGFRIMDDFVMICGHLVDLDREYYIPSDPSMIQCCGQTILLFEDWVVP